MYDKNRYNIVINLQLKSMNLKIKKKFITKSAYCIKSWNIYTTIYKIDSQWVFDVW